MGFHANIDPAAWLAQHDPQAAQAFAEPFPNPRSALELGKEALDMYNGDLSAALAHAPDLRAEIVLFYFLTIASLEKKELADEIELIGLILSRLNAQASAS